MLSIYLYILFSLTYIEALYYSLYYTSLVYFNTHTHTDAHTHIRTYLLHLQNFSLKRRKIAECEEEVKNFSFKSTTGGGGGEGLQKS